MEYTESIHDALYTLEYQLIPSYINNDGFIYLTSIESLFDGVSWDEMFEGDSWKNIDFQIERAAEQGSADACFALGDYYFNGYGNEPDLLLAKDWWEKAIERGHDGASFACEKYFGCK